MERFSLRTQGWRPEIGRYASGSRLGANAGSGGLKAGAHTREFEPIRLSKHCQDSMRHKY